ncbi:hypothetical protein [Isoalcanivorax pacificus]|uniref:hypothetical protein n=1 Tax=Isoalcanivorax pacificus TaxID=1306787 RepID=UPI0009E60A37|nr:hypothetical protein [Isoalcanivorax pacificus]
MKGRYQAAFIVPIGARKILNDDGWEFDGPARISADIKNYLIQSLGLSFLESYLGIESYVDGDIKMSVIFDDQNEIGNIHFQLYGNSLVTLSAVCQSSRISSEAEIFIPRQGQGA